MNQNFPDPERWSELPASGASAEHAIGAAMRRMKEATEPPDAAVARLALRVEAPARSWSARLAWRAVMVAILIMATGSAVGAALHRWWRASGGGHPERVAMSGPASARAEGHGARRGHRSPVAALDTPEPTSPQPPPEPEPAPSAATAAVAPILTPVAAPAPAARARRSAVHPVPAAAPPSEAGVLASAFHELRSSGDAAAALRALDDYDRRFPAGALRAEARVARAEALLALDRRREALPLLDGLEAMGGAPTRDVRVARAELRAEAGRCPDALRDFDAVVAVGEADAAGGRALYGRASCRLRTGDRERARQDLARYLVAHPNGPFAAAARRAVDPAP